MKASTPFRFGDPIYRYDVVTSTQDVAREWAQKGAKPGTVISARAMTAGRGRQGRKWEVPPGANVCLTTICPPVVAAEAWQIALAAGVAVVEAIRAVAPNANARTRFPNDVYANDVHAQSRKLAGILVETLPAPDGKRLPLLGIGVNVQAAHFTPEVAARALSVEEASGVPCDVSEMEDAIFLLLTALWKRWRDEGFSPLLKLWKDDADLSLSRAFVLDGAATTCCVTDISLTGTVSLISADGKSYTVPAAQIILGEDG